MEQLDYKGLLDILLARPEGEVIKVCLTSDFSFTTFRSSMYRKAREYRAADLIADNVELQISYNEKARIVSLSLSRKTAGPKFTILTE